ncbi:MAG TPA: PSD1 and planctomycete cytochrome C domain-containing protein [Pirellulales bacterium]|nr:PSD1 and planctomycete cytochrome C domain-containing protein [Pirellulales bacterium]
MPWGCSFNSICARACLRVFGLLVLLPGTSRAAEPPGEKTLPPPAERKIDFVKDVQPILTASCLACHGPQKQKSSYRVDVRAAAIAGGDYGEAIKPGDSAASPFIRYVAGGDEDLRMPAEGEPLSAEQVGILRAWIDQGAEWPASAGAKVDAKLDDKSDHWAYRPLGKPTPPSAGPHAAWVENPIDAFIAAELVAHKLAPSPPADKRLLIRRATFDLIGLPPTPEEVAAFAADEAPGAYERVVDRLLASPHYGERWARHWMDVVHFAETHGNDQDRPRPNAWPYRDYLIRSFNDDKPYARFAQEQLAGDVLFPGDPQGIVATGLIAAGPWDESSQQSIVDDTLDKKIARNLDRDDMATTAMSTFVSATVQCARCHNHKFDPISQAEYYGLQAVFSGVDRADRSYEPDPQVRERRLALEKLKAELAAGRAAVPLARLLDPAVLADAADWEQSVAAASRHWQTLEPGVISCGAGTTTDKQSDGSALFGGARPETDTYVITAKASLAKVTAVRLEVLADERLPQHGPGRQDNGNLHLSEFKLQAAPPADLTAARDIALESPTADFNQDGWTIAMAIDGQPKTAWGVYPQVGKSHQAVFELKEPLGGEGGAVLTFSLAQLHGGGHLIGRLRLSATGAEKPVVAGPSLPEAVARSLAVPAAERSDEQQAEIAWHVMKLRVDEQLAALPPPSLVYAAASDFKPEGNFTPAKTPRPVFVLRRGDVSQPLEAAAPGALACVPGLAARFAIDDPNDEGARRAALARWVSDPKNVLAWRSIVNRAWHYHFGRGIVETPNDFGRMGSPPTHPELLDWLASWFLEHDGSLKALDRLIVTSAAYRQSSKNVPQFAEIDAGNRYLWRMNRTRLDAEQLRDATLAISGKLDRTLGGPSVKQFIQSPGIHVTPKVDYENFDVDSPESFRRSVYRFLFRTLPDPFMDSMDCADASQLTPARNTSVTALQALAMLNNRFVVRQSEHFAARAALLGEGLPQQIAVAYELALGRRPTERESAALVAYAEKHGLANVCRLILNSNEFMFVQ